MTTDSGVRAPSSLTDNRPQTAIEATCVPRFNRTERAVHWTQATSFLVLLLSGFILSIPAFAALIGHRALLREIHLSTAFVFFFGPSIIALAGDRHSIALDITAIDTWDRDDLRWLIPFPILRLFGVPTPPQGKFNAGQKLNAIFVVASTLIFSVSGLIMWQNRRFPLDIVERANNIHTDLAYLALAAFLGHLFLATVYPPTRPALRAITQGWVRVEWARHHHIKWLLQPPEKSSPPAHDGLRTALQIIFGSAISLLAMRILFFALGANVTDQVTNWLYTITAWPGVAAIVPQTGTRVLDTPAIGYLVLCTLAWFIIDRMRNVPRHTVPE